MNSLRRFIRACQLVLLLLAAACLSGCRASKKVPAVPELATGERVFVGTPLSGPIDAAPPVTAALISQINVQWIALQQMPAGPLAPIDSQTQLTVAPDSDTALLTSARLTRPVKFAAASAAESFISVLNAGKLGPAAEIASRSAQIVPGATVEFTILPPGAAATAERRITLGISQPESRAATQSPTAIISVLIANAPATGDSKSIVTETAVIGSAPAADGAQWVTAFPLKSSNSPWNALVAVATINTGAADQDSVTRLQADLRQAAADARAGLTRSPLGDGPTIISALHALRSPESSRPALLLLTTLSNARIAGDFALVARDEQLAQFAAETLRAVPTEPLPSVMDLQWFFNRNALQTLCASAEKGELPSELQSILSLHTGDLANRPDALLDVLKQTGNADALEKRLIAENMIALEDNSPAARVRAFDWLAAQGEAPAGFDPMADAKSRRAAIDKAINPQGVQP